MGNFTDTMKLPGRARLIRVCHAEPVGCDGCLLEVASALAEEIRFNLQTAISWPTEKYQAELGGAGVCSLERAREFRRMTCSACALWTGGLSRASAGTLADFDLADWMETTPPPVAAPARRRFSISALFTRAAEFGLLMGSDFSR